MPIWISLILMLLQLLLQWLGGLTPATAGTLTPQQRAQVGAVGARCLKAATGISGLGIVLQDDPMPVLTGLKEQLIAFANSLDKA